MLWLCLRFPQLRSQALAATESEAMERLAAWAYQWSSWVSYRLSDDLSDCLLWLELAASRTLFGQPSALMAQIDAELTELGYRHGCALAPSPTSAALLSRQRGRPCALTRTALRAQLTVLPLTALELPTMILQALQAAGLRCIAEVLALPRAALARRFGSQCCEYLARLTAEASDPRPAFRLPSVYRARCEFDGELHETTALLFPLQRLLQEFQGYLRARDCAVQRFTLQLTHRNGTVPCTELPIGLSSPSREAARFGLLVRERLQSLALPSPVSALIVTADTFTTTSAAQQDLFGSEKQPHHELGELLDRLRARLGAQAVQSFQLQADHRPEHAFQRIPPQPAPSTAGAPRAACTGTAAQRPAALLASPQRIEPPALLVSGPERIETGWWDEQPIRRDYYIAHDAQGARLWVFQDLLEGSWFLQGRWV